MTPSPADVPWAALEHNYGAADDVPALLLACRDGSSVAAASAVGELDNLLYHQGGWVCSAATAALPFLVDLAEDPVVHRRASILSLVRMLAEAGRVSKPQFVDEGWASALRAVQPRIVALVSDALPGVRRVAVTLVADETSDVREAADTLLYRLRVEDDVTTVLDVLLALGRLSARDESLRDVRAVLADLVTGRGDRQVRLAAVMALAGTEPDLPARHVDVLVDAVTDPTAEAWLGSAEIGGTRATVVHRVGALLQRDPVRLRTFASAVLGSPDPERASAAAGQIGGMLSTWRDPGTADTVVLLTGQLASAMPEIRWRAAHLLGCLGSAAVASADAVVSLLDDAAAGLSRRSTSQVRDAAVWALARFADPACQSPLAAALRHGRTDLAPSGHSQRHWSSLWFVAPGLSDVLPMVGRPDPYLVKALGDRMAAAEPGPDWVSLCRVAAVWGRASARLVPVIADRLGRVPRGDGPAASALAAIGAEAAPVTDRLVALLTAADDDDDVAFTVAAAYATLSADPGPALAMLRRTRIDAARRPVLACAAALGPEAVEVTEALRPLVNHPSDWVRVEAARALWRVSGDSRTAGAALTDVVRRRSIGWPVVESALRYLGELAHVPEEALAAAREFVGSERRLSTSDTWRVFTEDEALVEVASALLRG